MGVRLGRNAKLYRNTATYGSPTWAEIEIVRDLSVPMSREEISADVRGSAFKLYAAGMAKIGIDFEILLDHDHADYVALLAAFTARTALDIFACTGAYNTSGEYYLRCDMKICDFSLGQPLKDKSVVTVSLKPCYSTNAVTISEVT